jgi:rSAM/selenodomain-associated transferase 1
VEDRLPALLLFARVPRDGRVKTRLAPALGAEGAARLYRAFLEDASRAYGRPCPWSPVLYADEDPRGSALPRLFGAPWRLERQSDGDLGTRLRVAFEGEFRRGAPAAAAVGSDHPALSRARLSEVFDRLAAGSRACLIPAEDGGYCAIGLSHAAPVSEVFREIPWSSAEVLEVTRARLSGAGYDAAILAPSYDVDRPEDLAKLAADVASRDPSEPDYPASTAAALASICPGGGR